MDYSILLIVVIYLVSFVIVVALTRKQGYAFQLIPGMIPKLFIVIRKQMSYITPGRKDAKTAKKLKT